MVRWLQAARCKEYCTASATRADNTSPHSTPKETYWRCAKLCNIKGNKDTQKQGREMGANGYKWLQSKHVWSRHVQHLWHLAAPACRALASIAVLVLQQCPACHVSFIVWKPELPFSKDSILLNIWGKVSWICTCFASAAFAAFRGLQILLCPSNQASTKPEMLHWNVALPNGSKQNKILARSKDVKSLPGFGVEVCQQRCSGQCNVLQWCLAICPAIHKHYFTYPHSASQSLQAATERRCRFSSVAYLAPPWKNLAQLCYFLVASVMKIMCWFCQCFIPAAKVCTLHFFYWNIPEPKP